MSLIASPSGPPTAKLTGIDRRTSSCVPDRREEGRAPQRGLAFSRLIDGGASFRARRRRE